jgi:hypothetical protein
MGKGMRRLLLLICLSLVSCITVRKLEITPLDYEADAEPPITVVSPVKSHLKDGSTVVFPKGVTVEDGKVKGEGFQYDITLDHSKPVTEVDIDDVAAMESYQTPVHTGATAAASTGATVAGGIGGLGLLKLVFGSCPTTYSLESREPILEAESFSYSIAPGFETRDVDRLGIDPGVRASVDLEMRNEALETHYINHVELLEVVHTAEEAVYPDSKGRPIVVGRLEAPESVVDRSGRRADSIVLAADGDAWSTEAERLRNVSADDMEDHIDVEFEVPPSTDGIALVLRMRNSLLNTVLLYDVMLRGQGFRALDWMGEELNRLAPKYRLARWYRHEMGMRISVWDGSRYRQVAALGDTGPIAWKELAIPLPDGKHEKLRVRLSFLADNWRIDQVALATGARKAKTRKIPITELTGAAGDELAEARQNLSARDDAYVITKPGEYLRLHFAVGGAPPDRKRTYFLAAEGYYIEWMRKEWLDTTSVSTFVPNDDALLAAIALWEQRRDGFREQFESTKIVVR